MPTMQAEGTEKLNAVRAHLKGKADFKIVGEHRYDFMRIGDMNPVVNIVVAPATDTWDIDVLNSKLDGLVPPGLQPIQMLRFKLYSDKRSLNPALITFVDPKIVTDIRVFPSEDIAREALLALDVTKTGRNTNLISGVDIPFRERLRLNGQRLMLRGRSILADISKQLRE